MSKWKSVPQIAFELSMKHKTKVSEWKVRKAVDKVLPDVDRIGNQRAIHIGDIGFIENEIFPKNCGAG